MIGPMGAGDTLPVWTFTLSGVNLTGATLALTIISQDAGLAQPHVAAAGTLSITNAAAGQGQYQWAAADLPTRGTYQLRLVATLPSGQMTFLETVTVF